jgi:excisionase family DNA binding protein
MSDKVLVPLPNGRWLALEPVAFRAALAAGESLIAAPAASDPAHDADSEPLLDAEALAAALSLPVTRIEAAARSGVIPAVRLGRRYRFNRRAVEAALAANGNGAA